MKTGALLLLFEQSKVDTDKEFAKGLGKVLKISKYFCSFFNLASNSKEENLFSNGFKSSLQ